MPSRRSLLALLGTALSTALGGCAAFEDATTERDDDTSAANPNSGTSTITDTDADTTTGESDETKTTSKPALSATEIDPEDVPDGATLTPVSPPLLELVSTAATTDGRVDSPPRWRVENREPLVLARFDYVRFQGETYEPTAEFVHFAQEASYQYTLEAVNESEFDGDVATYANLSADQRSVADEMLENGSYDVGHHEALPAPALELREYDGLRTENETYQLLIVVGDMAAHHMLRLDPATPPSTARVATITEEAVPETIRQTVRTAIADGSATLVNPDAVRSFVENTEFVLSSHTVARISVERPGS